MVNKSMPLSFQGPPSRQGVCGHDEGPAVFGGDDFSLDVKDVAQHGRRQYIVRRSRRNDGSFFHDNDVISILISLIHVVEDDDDGLLPSFIDVPEEL